MKLTYRRLEHQEMQQLDNVHRCMAVLGRLLSHMFAVVVAADFVEWTANMYFLASPRMIYEGSYHFCNKTEDQ